MREIWDVNLIASAKDRLIETLPHGIVIFDADARILDCNEKGQAILDGLGQETVDQACVKYVNMDAEGLANIKKIDIQIGEAIYSCQVNPVLKNGQASVFTVCFFEVTEERHHTKEILRMKEETEKANDVKSQFIAAMSHEIRTPMNAIIGMSELALRKEMEPDLRMNLEHIFQSAKSLLSLVNNLLDLSKIEAGRFELVKEHYYLDSMIFDVANMMLGNMMLGNLMEKPIYFQVEFTKDIPNGLVGDVQRIKEILFNLLGNAIKYTKRGSITLVVSGEELEDEEFLLELRVQDTGLGIKKEDQSKIFEKYVQVDKKKNKGIVSTGLGLPITKELVELMEGEIIVESEYERGSTFIVRLKQEIYDRTFVTKRIIADKDMIPYATGQKNQRREPIYFPEARVLLVDDIYVNLKVAQGMMEPYRMKIDLAGSAREAIQKIQENAYDIVFMDQMMPEMDGIEAAEYIRGLGKRYESLVMIALTANTVAGAREYYHNRGFDGYMSKPIITRELEQVLIEMIPGKLRTETEFEAKESAKQKMNQTPLEILFAKGDIPGIDLKKGIAHIGGKEKEYYFLLRDYQRELKRTADTIGRLLEREDLKEFCVGVHGMKGSSYNLGAEELGSRSEGMETAARMGDRAYLRENIKDYVEYCRFLWNSIEKFRESGDVCLQGQIAEETIGDEREYCLQRLRNMQKESRKYNLRAMEELLEGLQVIADKAAGEGEKLFWELAKAVEELEYKRAEDLAAELETLYREKEERE